MGSEGNGGFLFLDVCLDCGVDLGGERDGGILLLVSEGGNGGLVDHSPLIVRVI